MIAQSGQDPVSALLAEHGITSVALIDDAYDPLDGIELDSSEIGDLWARLQADDRAMEELTTIGHPLVRQDELTGSVLAAFVARRSDCPAVEAIWLTSTVGGRIESTRSQVDRLKELLEQHGGLTVRTFGATSPTDALLTDAPQLLFLDWHLGDIPAAQLTEPADGLSDRVEAAVAKVKSIHSQWPPEHPMPLIVLMSSRLGLREHADEFCRRSDILRGMFYAVPKGELTELFKLRMHLRLFAMSLPAAQSLQAFVGSIRDAIDSKKEEFIAGIRDLSLTDYAYVQRLSLQDDGQPLGDYLLWLFSSYFGQLIFADALGEQRKQLDRMTFDEALPSLGPPSERLTALYHCALFDTSVSAVGSDSNVPEESAVSELSDLTLGDVLGSQSDTDLDAGDQAGGARPDLYLVINAQCDLQSTPTRAEPDRTVLLLPGRRRLLSNKSTVSGPKTELYLDRGQSYRIEWDTKRALTVRHGEFENWKKQERYELVARLRLPFALEVQRAFAADLTRIGMPVMPPIYQPISARLLRANGGGGDAVFETEEALNADEAAFLVLTRTGQRYVLTLPLVTRLKEMLDERLVELQEAKHPSVAALEQAIGNEADWANLVSPAELPKPGGAKPVLRDYIQVVRGKSVGDKSNKAIVAVSIDSDGLA